MLPVKFEQNNNQRNKKKWQCHTRPGNELDLWPTFSCPCPIQLLLKLFMHMKQTEWLTTVVMQSSNCEFTQTLPCYVCILCNNCLHFLTNGNTVALLCSNILICFFNLCFTPFQHYFNYVQGLGEEFYKPTLVASIPILFVIIYMHFYSVLISTFWQTMLKLT